MFVAAAEAGNFSEAGRRLGVSPSAVSQAIRGLEERLGAPLFRRSTRSLGLTDVGKDYLLLTAPALSQLRQAAEEASGKAGRPAGPLRLTMPRAPFDLLVAPALAAFQDAYPDVNMEIAVEARLVDIVKEGYDAGLRYGNYIDGDMVAVRVAPASASIFVASPAYLEKNGTPAAPSDLIGHRSIACRSQSAGTIIPWDLRCDEATMKIVPQRAMVVHDLASQIDLAERGVGILSVPVAMVCDRIQNGTLSQVLPAWSSPIEALYLYFPSRRHQSSALRAFVAFIKGHQS